MKKIRVYYSGKPEALAPILAKMIKEVQTKYSQELKEGIINFIPDEKEVIMELSKDENFMRDFMKGWDSFSNKVGRKSLSLAGVKTKIDVFD